MNFEAFPSAADRDKVGLCLENSSENLQKSLATSFADAAIPSEAGLRTTLLANDPIRHLKILTAIDDELSHARSFSISVAFITKSGIAPFYSDKYAKVGIQVCELYDEEMLRDRLKIALVKKNALLEGLYHKPDVDLEALLAHLKVLAEKIRPMVGDTTLYLHKALKEGKTVLLEGQLGTLRDPDHGIYPYTTSSSPLAGYGCVGAGVSPKDIQDIYCVTKAYSSAVGAGPFVVRLSGPEGDELRRRGGDAGEFGATTGRARDVGWFDCVATRYGVMVQGGTQVVLTNLDVLGYLDEIPVCVAYEVDGEEITDFPSTPKLLRCKGVYKNLPGWKCDIRGIKKFEDLPENCRKYVEFLEQQIGAPIHMVSNGPRREDIIYR